MTWSCYLTLCFKATVYAPDHASFGAPLLPFFCCVVKTTRINLLRDVVAFPGNGAAGLGLIDMLAIASSWRMRLVSTTIILSRG
jgi:hypothetical protein